MKMNLRQEYNNIRIKEGDDWKVVFSVSEDTFKLIVIFFGLTNSLVTFQAIMNDLLRDMIEVGDVVVFINNIMVETETEEGHDSIVKEILKRTAKNNLFIKLEKYIQKVREVGFLGVIIELDRVKMEKEKVQKVMDQLVPKSVKNVQKFFGLANYYRQFVKDFTRVAKLLHEITRKDIKQNWKERQQRAFEELKERFIMEPVLITLNLDKEMRVEVEVLDFAIEGVLSMKCEDEK